MKFFSLKRALLAAAATSIMMLVPYAAQAGASHPRASGMRPGIEAAP